MVIRDFKLDKPYTRRFIVDASYGKEERIMYSLREREVFYLQELRPGMVLAEPVLDRSGNRLLNSDITLDDSKISKLKTRGISKVLVKREERFQRF